MNKIAVITDLHFGIRNDSEVFLKHNKRFFDEIFFPYLAKHDIKAIFILGDIWDKRKYLNYSTYNFIRTHFLEKLTKYHVFMLVGNHDSFHSNTLAVNSINEVTQVREGNKFVIIKEPQEVKFTWGKVLFLPWICDDNEKQSLELIQKTDAKICFGHLQIQGFEMHAGSYCNSGLDCSTFDKFELVASGHFHQRSSRGPITFLGAALEQTWADYDSDRGFHIFNTDTKRLEFIKNPYEIFHKIVYNDANQTREQVLDWNFGKFQDCYVKVIVQSKTNPNIFDDFISALEKYAEDVKIIEDFSLMQDDDIELDEKVEDTISILNKFVEKTNVANKDELSRLLIDIYHKALVSEE